jgi:hypothetical protein
MFNATKALAVKLGPIEAEVTQDVFGRLHEAAWAAHVQLAFVKVGYVIELAEGMGFEPTKRFVTA